MADQEDEPWKKFPEPWKKFRNPFPPSEDFDYETTVIGTKVLYYTDFGTPCQFMNEIDEKHFQVSSEPEDLSSSDDENEYDDDDEAHIIKEVFAKNTSAEINEVSAEISSLNIKHEVQNKGQKRTKSSDLNAETEYEPSKKLRTQENRVEIDDEFEKFKVTSGIDAAFGEYICGTCNVTMNSEAAFKIHEIGKKHIKAVRSQQIPEVALQSLSTMNNECGKIKARSDVDMRILPSTHVQEPTVGLRYPIPPAGIKRVETYKTSHIQRIADHYRRGPVPGLSNVLEIRQLNTDVYYYCKLCDAPCSPTSIMPHLTGYKHLLFSLKEIDLRSYEKYSLRTKKEVEHKVLRLLAEHERTYGRGVIKVLEDFYSSSREFQSESSWRMEEPSYGNDYQVDMTDMRFVSSPEFLDISQNDFRCKLCDAHMNNKSMWEAHIRGKRHMKNEKKCPGESASKLKSFPCPDERAHLMNLLYDVGNEPIVGLSYIRETQSKAGFLYNCFLCGACTSDYDIVEHLLTTKHKVKFLEAANKVDKKNGIEDIKVLHDVSAMFKDSLINEQCEELLQKYGPGKVEVYKMKRNGW